MLSVHMWLSTSPWCTNFFFSNERPHPCLSTSPIQWSEPLNLSLQSHHNIALGLWTRLNLQSQRTVFITGRFCTPCPHVMAIAAPVFHCSGSWALFEPEPIDSHRHSNSLPTPSPCHLPLLFVCPPSLPIFTPLGKSFGVETWGKKRVKMWIRVFLPSLCIGTQVAA